MDRLRPVFRWSPFRWGTKCHRSPLQTTTFVITTGALAVATFISTPADAAGPWPLSEKEVITSIDQLPRHTYAAAGSVVELLESDEALLALGAKLRVDLVADLETYDIKDDTALQQYHGVLANLDLLIGDTDGFFGHTDAVRKLEEKPATRLLIGLVSVSAVEARLDPAATSEDAFRTRFQEIVRARVEAMPWDLVEDQIEQIKGQLEIVSENLLVGIAQSQIDPAVQSTGQMSGDVAGQVIGMAVTIRTVIPVKEDAVVVLQEIIDANRTEKEDIWPSRDVTFSEKDGLSPVLLAVWDTGVDTEVFSDRLFVNPRERFDGKDTDGNGFVDDVNGIAYDLESDPTPELLYPITDAAPADELDRIKGFFDLQAAVESPEAQAMRKDLATMQPDDVPPFFEGLMQCAIYVHGTHVGGIAVEGNPAAEVLTARLTADHRMIPEAPTVERSRKGATQLLDSVEYFKVHGAQVVNMSWGMSVKDEEIALERNGIGDTPEERQKMAREIFDISRDALYEALQNAPDILFVAAAGNEDNDVKFDDEAPAAFDLPNVMIVGAVDQAGEPTGFTSFGETVDVYANGFEVESFVPGGDRMAFSGTSMASPNAANLAAKLLALDPSLTPEELIEIIIRGSDRYDADERILLINPKRTVELLRSREG